MDPKEIFIQEQERIAAELEEQGMPADQAYDTAADKAYSAMQDRFADAADEARMRAKENR